MVNGGNSSTGDVLLTRVTWQARDETGRSFLKPRDKYFAKNLSYAKLLNNSFLFNPILIDYSRESEDLSYLVNTVIYRVQQNTRRKKKKEKEIIVLFYKSKTKHQR